MHWTEHTQSHHNHTHAMNHFTNDGSIPNGEKRAFNSWEGKYDFNLTACVSDADSHVATFSFAGKFNTFFSIRAHIKLNMGTYIYINFILRWCFNVAPHSLFSLLISSSANVYFRGCVFFFMRHVFSYYPWSRCENLRYFDFFFFLLVLHQFH